MLEKIKSYAVIILGAVSWLLFGWIYLLNGRLQKAQQQAALDEAKQGVADALAKVNQDNKEATDADAKFDSLSATYIKSSDTPKS